MEKKALVTGCAGFIGSHTTIKLLQEGFKVTGIDNLSRKGTSENLNRIHSLQNHNFTFIKSDIREEKSLNLVFQSNGPFHLIIHEAGQVAVTQSINDPRNDFEINALGTFNILESTRKYSPEAFFIFASTNKVYGKLHSMEITESLSRYEYINNKEGVTEDTPLDFFSPYGVSKGAADQYTHDYFRIYGLKTVVFRQSCIYGDHQFGIEDQGWVAWFIIASILQREINIYGNGKQTRDILWIEDLVDAYIAAYRNQEKCKGEVFNIGGGNNNSLSLNELVQMLKELDLIKENPPHTDWRPGDQEIYISNTQKFENATNWKAQISSKKGVLKLIDWADKNLDLISQILK